MFDIIKKMSTQIKLNSIIAWAANKLKIVKFLHLKFITSYILVDRQHNSLMTKIWNFFTFSLLLKIINKLKKHVDTDNKHILLIIYPVYLSTTEQNIEYNLRWLNFDFTP